MLHLWLIVVVSLVGTCVSQLQTRPGASLSTILGASLSNSLGASRSTSLGASGSTTLGASRVPTLSQPATGHCTSVEQQTAFDNCMFQFGYAHMRHFDTFRRFSPACRIDLMDCKEVDVLMKCLNTQPVNVISNSCWNLIPKVLTNALHTRNIPCSYEDLYKKCKPLNVTELIPVSARTTGGTGVTNNPRQQIMARIRPMINMIIFMRMQAAGAF